MKVDLPPHKFILTTTPLTNTGFYPGKKLIRCSLGYDGRKFWKKVLHEPHVDMPGFSNTTAIYYVSDADGDTVLYNEN